ncbi:MAG: hypothetical protein K2I30_03670 [Clostridia bacterium]|nr:hypothetical protein [Clostridia bacterium]
MSRKNRKDDDLDIETTFADMNIDGFRWYDPSRKKNNGEKRVRHKISRKEYWQMVRGAFAAYAPFFVIVILALGAMVALAYLWLS